MHPPHNSKENWLISNMFLSILTQEAFLWGMNGYPGNYVEPGLRV